MEPSFDVDLDFNYNHFGSNSAAVAQFGQPGGSISVWSLSFQPAFHLCRATAQRTLCCLIRSLAVSNSGGNPRLDVDVAELAGRDQRIAAVGPQSSFAIRQQAALTISAITGVLTTTQGDSR